MLLKCFIIIVQMCADFELSNKVDESDSDYLEVPLEFSDDSNNDYMNSDYDDDLKSMMTKAHDNYMEYNKLLASKKSPTPYISTNKKSEEMCYEERKTNIVSDVVKKEQDKCNLSTKNRTWAPQKNTEKWCKQFDQSRRRRGASLLKGSKETDGMCNPHQYEISCDPDQRWRNMNGTCNNIRHAHWGSNVILFPRFMKSTYDDGHLLPRGGWDQKKIPSSRWLSVNLSHPKYPFKSDAGKKFGRHRTFEDDIPSDLFTHITVSFGQFLAHEMSLTSEPEFACCDQDIIKAQENLPLSARICWNIDISNDTFFKRSNVSCHPFSRSNYFICDQESENPGAQQVNGVTSFIDASAIYGEDNNKDLKLRKMKDGLLKTGNNKTHEHPTQLPEAQQCGFKSGTFYIEDPDVEVSGDTRAALHPSLAATHTLFMAEHNRIAKELKKRLESVKLPKDITMDELLFQETRIIVIAMLQKITFNEYLHSVLGPTRWKSEQFPVTRTSYSANDDPSIRNEFTTAAFRFGHSNAGGVWVPVGTDRLQKKGIIPEFRGFRVPEFWPLRWHYFDTSLFITSFYGEEWNEELLGTIYQPAQKTDLFVSDDMTDYLFGISFKEIPDDAIDTDKADFPKEDLVARNIQRGRDHGIATYNQARQFCKLEPLTSFDKQPKEISEGTWKDLSKAYTNVDDIDLYMGGYSEIPLEQALVGSTFACIIVKQFKLLKQGDRYFFSHSTGSKHKGVSDILYKEVEKRTLGDIMCDNMNILENNGTQRDVFMLKNDVNNAYIPCKGRKGLDFNKIAEDILQFYNNKSEDCVEYDTDYFMNDIVHINQAPLISSWWECSELCRNKYEKCKYWTFLGQKCLVKTSKYGKRKKKGAISGSHKCGSNFGSEEDSSDSGSGSGEDSSGSASGSGEDSSGSGSGSGEDSSGSAYGLREDSSGFDCVEYDTDYFLNDIVPFYQAPLMGSWWECSELCRNKYEKCKYWTFLGQQCFVKSSKDGRRKMKGAISGSHKCGSNFGSEEDSSGSGSMSGEDSSGSASGSREDSSGSGSGSEEDSSGSAYGLEEDSFGSNCIEYDTDYVLNDIVPFNQAPLMGSWWECSELCRNKYEKCKYWTFIGQKCLVKTSKDGKRKMKGAISGGHHCGFNFGKCAALNPTTTNEWCESNCNHIPPNCPSSHCKCK